MTQHPKCPTGVMENFPWSIELFALAANLLSMAALVTVLAVYDGNPIFYWHKVTLNTIVSVISTAAKAPMLYAVTESISQWKWMISHHTSRRLIDFQTIDSASRGPLGSLKLLWNCREGFFLQLGAIITIISIAIDPFSQQLVQYELVPVNVPTPEATISTAQRYSRGIESIYISMASNEELEELNGTIDSRTNADFQMQAAVFYGLSHSLEETVKQVQLKCPSGNCTWDPFESLAVCSICNDISANLTYENLIGTWEMASIRKHDDVITDNRVTKFKLPNGLFIDNMPHMGENKTAWMASFGTGDPSETVSLEDTDTLIWGMSIIRPQNTSAATWEDVRMEAIECGLYYCVNRYTTSVENAKISEMEETVVNASRSPDSWKPLANAVKLEMSGLEDDELFTPEMSGLEDDELFTPEISVVDNDDSLNFQSDLGTVIRRSDLMLGDNFNISQSAVYSISSFFQQTFRRSTDANSSNPAFYISGFSRSADDFEPAAMQPFISIPDLSVPFVSLARSMTNALRANSENTPQTGRISVLQTYYVIVWPWIALHAVVIIAGTTFMLVTMRETRKCGIPVWTSSALAIISEGDNARDVLKGAITRRDLEQRAEMALVQFGGPGRSIECTSTRVLAREEPHSSDSDTYTLEESTQKDIKARRRGPQSTYSAISTDDAP